MVIAAISNLKRFFSAAFLLFTVLFVFLSCSDSSSPDYDLEYSVIFCIGDGMGYEQIEAAKDYLSGGSSPLVFESFPVRGSQTTYCADSSITDSAASATAMACGRKVNKGVISKALPGNGSDMQTLLETAGENGMSTGVVTTTAVTHATPAAFAAHVTERTMYDGIFSDYMKNEYLDLVMGGGGAAYGIDETTAQNNGFTVLTTREEMLNSVVSTSDRIAGFFGDDHIPYEYDGVGDLPHLSEMAEFAFDFLDSDPDGFFLLIEGGRIDHACHDNDIERAIHEVIEFEETVETIQSLISGRNDIILIVTADHETGGLQVLSNNGQGNYPTVSWSTDYHTGVEVPYFIWGAAAADCQGITDNTEYFDRMVRVAENW